MRYRLVPVWHRDVARLRPYMRLEWPRAIAYMLARRLRTDGVPVRVMEVPDAG